MSIFYGHLSDDEKEIFIIENSFDIGMRKLGAKLDVICESVVINMAEAENKVIMESGTTDDLDILFEAAATENKISSGNIISSMISKIKKFIDTISDKIKTAFTKDKADNLIKQKEVKDIPQLDESRSKLTALASEAKIKIAKLIHGGNVSDNDIQSFKSKAKKIGIVTAGITAATVTGKVLHGKINNMSSEIEKLNATIDSMDKMTSDTNDNATPEGKKKIKDILMHLGIGVKNSSNMVFQAITIAKTAQMAIGM